MNLKTLKVIGFRNLNRDNFVFNDNKNLVFGPNGAGKTSILEAIFLLGFGRSFLNVKKCDMVGYGTNQFFVEAELSGNFGSAILSAHYENNFQLMVNQKTADLKEVNRYLAPVFFSSSNYGLYIESRSFLRKMIDRFIFGVDSLYLHYILSYNKALRQKNHLLKKGLNLSQLHSWNQILSEMGFKIWRKRVEFIEDLNREIADRYSGDLALHFRASVEMSDNVSADVYLAELETKRDQEIMRKRSLSGAHLDYFFISFKQKDLKFYSSGEKKINLLFIYLTYIELFKKMRNEYPIFLVDDFDTAMDESNISLLNMKYPEIQIIATSVNNRGGYDKTIELCREA